MLLPDFKVANPLSLCKNTAMQATGLGPTLLETALRRDKYVVLGGLLAITILSWAYLVYLSQGMEDMGDMASMAMSGGRTGAGWAPVDFSLTLVMWVVMMVAMMVPSAAPMVLAFSSINRRRREQGNPFVPTSVFLSGYLAVWAGFSVVATLAQLSLSLTFLLSPMMASANPVFGAVLLLTAGAFQLSPLKGACLRHCRTPMSFITNDWREGRRGALMMGLHHGGYCLGCCWALMGLLFLLGVMNLVWIAALAGFVLAEKVVPGGIWVGRLAGLALVAWGIWMLGSAFWV